MLAMRFIRRGRPGRLLGKHGPAILAVSVSLLAAGCMTMKGPISMESPSFAKRFGLDGCRVSVPMSAGAAREIGRKWELYPDPEGDPEWMKMIAAQQVGDELRLVSCEQGDPYFYALIRSNVVIFKYKLSVLD